MWIEFSQWARDKDICVSCTGRGDLRMACSISSLPRHRRVSFSLTLDWFVLQMIMEELKHKNISLVKCI